MLVFLKVRMIKCTKKMNGSEYLELCLIFVISSRFYEIEIIGLFPKRSARGCN